MLFLDVENLKKVLYFFCFVVCEMFFIFKCLNDSGGYFVEVKKKCGYGYFFIVKIWCVKVD